MSSIVSSPEKASWGALRLDTAIMTTTSIKLADTIETIKNLADKYCEGRLFLAGGGGYNPDSTARAWVLMTMILLDHKLPEKVPENWLNYCKDRNISANSMLLDEKQEDLIPEEYSEYSSKLKEVLQEYIYSFLENENEI